MKKTHTQILQALSSGPAEIPAVLCASTFIMYDCATAGYVETSFKHYVTITHISAEMRRLFSRNDGK